MKDEKISLCVIAGNAEKYIARFLTSFRAVADEIIVVRAIGSKVPDNTLKIAERDFHCITAEYHNAAGHESWPHVDDFAAARNLAFSLGSHSWLMWADLDDVIAPDSIAAIRYAVETAEESVHCLCFRYVVPDDKLTISRERLVRRGSARWVEAIHETLKPLQEGSEGVRAIDAEIVHSTLGVRKENNERNLRIMQSLPEESRTPGIKFHLALTLHGLHRTAEAQTAVQHALLDPALESPERYELLMVLSQLVTDPKQRVRILQSAAHESPERREAWGELSLFHLAGGDQLRSSHYAEIMASRPAPRVWPWNARRKFWGWLGIELEAMALRASGHRAKADAIEYNFFHENGAMISLLHATRGRPAQALAARLRWLERAKNPDAIEHIFALDDDDAESGRLLFHRGVMVPAGGGCVRAWNAAAAYSSGKILIQLSDDWEPPLHWDELILDRMAEAVESQREAVLQVSDGHRQDDLLCMAILTRQRWEHQGYLFHPDFLSMHSDNWFSYCAFRDGVVKRAKEIVFEHLHPVFGRGQWDKTYEVSNDKSRYTQGAAVMERLMTSWQSCRGWFDFPQTYARAAALVKDRPQSTVVEVGCAYGKSIVYLASLLPTSAKLYAVDTFAGSPGETGYALEMLAEFRENLKRCGIMDRVTTLAMPSHTAATQIDSCDFVFLDAGHDEASVRADIAAWWPKIKPGGVLAGHDYAYSADVRRVVDEIFPTAEKIESCWWIKKS